ncbi:hypothetical protein PG994_005520 [Apiospora phragmitis]|uniref:Apple domain-containing protein n=1 Tax=Apiospora phragmitis TaxID=2905665 RepID=A0ABR1VCG5_9PEZI
MPLPALLKNRQSGSPCPSANGGQIGTLRTYNVLCGSRLAGKEIGGQQTESLGDCVDLCNDHAGPRCDGVVYQSNGHCILQASINKSATTLDAGADSAIVAGMLQKPSSSCDTLGSGSVQSANGMNFQISCNKVVSGNDFEVQFQMSFEDCMRVCAKDQRCGGVSFEARQSFGFKNCYLKSPFSATSNQILDQPSIDTARLLTQDGNDNPNNNNGQANRPPPAASPPKTTLVEVTMTIVTSAPATIVIMTTAADLSTGAGVATVPLPETKTLTTLSATTRSAKPASESGAPATAGGKAQGSLAPGSTDPAEAPDAPSMMKIAGPVAGGVAFLGLVAVAIFFFCRRRRQRQTKRRVGGHAEKGGWVGLGDGRQDEGGPLARPETASSGKIRRNTTISMSEVRDSQNGLKLHRMSTHAYGDPGIPAGFEGPHAVKR